MRSFTTVLPATIQDIERYLGSGLIKGIGPKMAARSGSRGAAGCLGFVPRWLRCHAVTVRPRQTGAVPSGPAFALVPVGGGR